MLWKITLLYFYTWNCTWFGQRSPSKCKISDFRLLTCKVYKVWPKKVQTSSLMTLKSDAKFEEKLTCFLESDMRNLVNFQQSIWKYLNWDFDGILLSKIEIAWAKNLQRIYVYWQWRKDETLEEELTCHFKLKWGIWRILTQALESLKNLQFNGLLLTNLYNVWPKKVQRSYLPWHWRLMQNLKS